MSQSDVVTLLRNVPLDSSVTLVVSRHSSAADGSDSADGKSPKKNNDLPPPSHALPATANNVQGGLVMPAPTTRKLQFQLDEKTDEEVMKRKL